MSCESYRKSHSQNNYGKVYSKTYQKGYYYYQWGLLEKPILEALFQRLSSKENKKDYLDFACGTGRILSLGEKYFDTTCGVDVSSAMLDEAKKNCKGKLILQDLTKKSLNKQFDVMTAFRFFLNAEEELKNSALQSIYKHLKADGVLIANIHMNKTSILGYIYSFVNFLKGKKIYSLMTYQDFQDLLEKNDFRIEEAFWYSYLPRTGWYFSFIPKYFMKPLDNIVHKLSFLPKMWGQSFIVIARKK